MDNTTFIFDGKNSEEMGLHIVRIDSGFYSSPFISGQSIIEDEINSNHIPVFYKIKKEPFKFDITFSLLDEEFTNEKKFELARWLIQEEYKQFISTDNIDKIYYVIATNQSDFMSAGMKLGYFTINFRTNAPWAYTPVYINQYDLSNILVPTTINIENKSNVLKYYKPEIEIELTGVSTGVTLTNLSNQGKQLILSNLSESEVIYINNTNKQIISNLSMYRLGNWNKQTLDLVYGVNNIEVNNPCIIITKCQYPILM